MIRPKSPLLKACSANPHLKLICQPFFGLKDKLTRTLCLEVGRLCIAALADINRVTLLNPIKNF